MRVGPDKVGNGRRDLGEREWEEEGGGQWAWRDGPFTYLVPGRRGHTCPEVVQNRQAHPEECPAPTCCRRGHIINPDSGRSREQVSHPRIQIWRKSRWPAGSTGPHPQIQPGIKYEGGSVCARELPRCLP